MADLHVRRNGEWRSMENQLEKGLRIKELWRLGGLDLKSSGLAFCSRQPWHE